MNLAYAMLGQVWGIVIPLLGGAIWVLVAAICFLSVGGQALHVYKPVVWALCTGTLVIAIQLLFHQGTEEALKEGTYFLSWLAVVITAQSLSLRPGFLQRFAVAALAIGLATVPYIQIDSAGGIMRGRASGTGIATPNVLGMWFGFCTLYFVFWGLQARKLISRAAIWTAAVGCFFVVLIAVSRGPLLGVVLALVVGFRSALKRSFVPLLTLVLSISGVYMSGVFDDWIGYYFVRGAEETGREKLYSIALERILNAPWIGVGLGNIAILRHGTFVNPHNGLLHIALGAGIVPLICFLGYLAQAAIGALRIMRRGYVGEAALLPPLVVFALVEIMILDFSFMSPWVVVVLGLAA
ncbi:MAG: O-antigen ligase family protein, partial [Nitrospiraceae bacterium]